MELGFLGGFLALALVFELSLCQELNTNEFFISSFLQSLDPPSSLNYNFSSPVCSWQGVVCDSLHHVTELRFSGLGLSGVIPENTIGKLGKLESVDLSNNQIAGVSSDFWSLGSTLKRLNLSCNKINGSLSNNLGNFEMLESLDLSSNFYSGSIPQTIGSLSTLQLLNLSANSFEGEIPFAILSFKSLVSMDISSNMLTGTLPEGLGDELPDLAELNLARNKLSGSISEITGMKSLRSLNLSDNAFMGSIKDAFQQPKVVLDLSKNKFQGHISQVLLNSSFNWSVTEFLDLSENQLSGEINLNLNQLAQSLRHLNLAHNRFSHQNFPTLEQLLSLDYLNLSQTNLQGPIPGAISELVNLRTLDLSHNQLNDSVANLNSHEFQVLDLSVNNLTGEFPLQLLRKLPDMEKYNFSYNNFTLCASNIPSEEFKTTFFGSQDDCPIAVDPGTHMPEKKREGSKHGNLKLALALTFSILCFALGLLCLALACRRKSSLWAVKHAPDKEEPSTAGPFSFQTDSTTWVADVKSAQSVPVVIFDKPLLNYTFADLLSVTSNFDRGTLLAEGRFGPVYRGFLPGGTQIAVKVFVHGSTMTDPEAAKELEYLGRIKHPNLVPLIGYCLAGEQRIAIYEYMENGNLRNLLHDLPLGVPRVEDWSSDTWEEGGNVGEIVMSSEGFATWAFRHRIALGTARALAFLHHGCFPQIIHRDVKASSVYLGPELEPRLSDFGLSKIFGSDFADQLTRAAPGYTPPELSNGDELETATSKSDVYGFGVVLFELLTGKKPFGDECPDEKDATLVSWVRRLVRKGQGSRAIDPKIIDTGSEEQMVEALRIGFLCTADLPSKRPDMNQVVGLLKDVEPVLLHLDG